MLALELIAVSMIIRPVEQSHLSAKQTLDKLGIPRSTFYACFDKNLSGSVEALKDKGANLGIPAAKIHMLINAATK